MPADRFRMAAQRPHTRPRSVLPGTVRRCPTCQRFVRDWHNEYHELGIAEAPHSCELPVVPVAERRRRPWWSRAAYRAAGWAWFGVDKAIGVAEVLAALALGVVFVALDATAEWRRRR